MARVSFARASLSAGLLVFLFGSGMDCGPTEPHATGTSATLGGDGGICALATAGCACTDGTRPEDCYLDPIPQSDGSILCKQGTYYCRSGTWSSCENVRSYVLPATTALISTGTCNPCNPNCVDSNLTPDPGDLNSGNSSNTTYDPNAPGITLTSSATAGAGPDSDNDGVPDVADQCVGPGWLAPCSGTTATDGWYHTLAYGGAAAIDPLNIAIKVKTADVYVLMDATGSMAGEISNLQSTLTTGTYDGSCTEGVNGGVLGAVRCTIPDAWFGVGWVREVANGASSSGYDDVAYQNLVDISSDFSLATRAVNALDTNGNYDWPEAQVEALYALASGMGFGRWVPNRASCANGGFSYACFRPNTIPIVILFTDAPFHQGQHPYNYGYTDASQTLPTMSFGSGTNALLNESAATAFDFGDLTSAASTSVMGTTNNMTNDFPNATGCTYWSGTTQYTTNSVGGPDAVYKFNVTATKTLTFDTTGSDFDTNLSIWKDNGNGTYTQVACNDNRQTAPTDYAGRKVFTTTSYLSQSLGAGTYYVVVDGHNSVSGGYRLNVNTGTAAANAATTAFPATWSQAISALNAHSTKVISVISCACATQAIALGQCQAASSTQLAACSAAKTTCNAACDSTLTSCYGSCSSADTSCQSTCDTNQTACNTSCTSSSSRTTICSNYCSASLTDCGAACTSTYNTCETQCASALQTCKNSRPKGCYTTSCINAWNTECASTDSATTCQSKRDSGCSTNSCKTSWNTMCSGARGTCDTTCASNQTTCNSTCSSNNTTCNSSCTGTATACQTTACAYNASVCSTSCTNTQASCQATCDTSRTACGNTCTTNYNTCAAVAGCTTQQSNFNACYNALSYSDQESANDCYNTYVDASALGTQTGSIDSSGAPYVYTISPDGTGLGSTVVSAVQNLASYTRFDINVTCQDNPATTFNECLFVQSIAPAPGGCPSSRCNGGISGSMCLGCLPGSMVNYTVNFQNNAVMPTTVPQVFDFNIISYAGSSVMQTIPVRIVVPASVAQVAPQGTFQVDYDSTLRCTVPPDRPTWGNFTYTASTPSDSSIVFSFATADTLAGLDTAPAVTRTLSATSNPGDPIALGSVLTGTSGTMLYLRVKATLNANSTLTQSPVINSWDVQYTCNPAE